MTIAPFQLITGGLLDFCDPELLVQPVAVALTVNAAERVAVLLVIVVQEPTHEGGTKTEKQYHDDPELLLRRVLKDVLPVPLSLSTDQDEVPRSQQHLHADRAKHFVAVSAMLVSVGVLAKTYRFLPDFLLHPEPLHLEVFQAAKSLS